MKYVSFVCLLTVLVSVIALAQSNPVPLIHQPLVPMSTTPGSAAFTLTVNGAGFVSGAVVQWNGTARNTTFVSSTRLTANILASDVAAAGTGTIRVVNPAPQNHASNVVYFPVTHSSPFVAFAGGGLFSQNYPQFLVSADLNHDQNLDLVVSNWPNNTISVILGNGDGNFRHFIDYKVSDGGDILSDIAVGDFNGDDETDVAVTGFYSARVVVFLGNGDGTLRPPGDFPTLTGPNKLITADFNGDGNLDFAITCCTNQFSILLGNGDGTFQLHVDYVTGNSPRGIATADFNGDGILDLVTSNESDYNVSVLLGRGDGTFLPAQGYSVGKNPDGIVAADFNGDGKLDLVVPLSTGASPIAILLGNGDGSFRAPRLYPANAGGKPLAGDFNGDGKLDLALIGAGVTMLLGNGDGSFQKPRNSSGPAYDLATGDFNGDGRLDLAIAGYSSGRVPIKLQTTAGLTPGNLYYGDQPIGTRSAPQNVVVTNLGATDLTINGITIVGTSRTEFSKTHNCPAKLAPAATCTISVTFAPTTKGAKQARLSVSDSALGSPHTVHMTGNGT